MQPFTRLKSTYVVIAAKNIDTDQIIPARFLKTTDKTGLGDQAFYDWRYDQDGTPKTDFVLNRPESREAKILVAGDNFGCGSSREHAPWALSAFGFRAIISTSFADIFRNNAYKNGLLTITVDEKILSKLVEKSSDDTVQIDIDLQKQSLILPWGETIGFDIDNFNKTCMLEGLDQLGYIRQFEDQIEAYERRQTPRVNTQS